MAAFAPTHPLHPLRLFKVGDRVEVKTNVLGFGDDPGTIVRMGAEDALVGGITVQLDRRPTGRLTTFWSHELRSAR